MIKLTETVKHLIIINVLFFLATIAFKEQIYDLLAMHFPKNPLFKSWQIITHMFMHADEMHLIFNMFGLWMFGSVVENILGRNKFLILYFSAGLGAILLNTGIDYFQFNSFYEKLLQTGMNPETIQRILNSGEYNPKILSFVSESNLTNFYSNYITRLVGASGALYGIMVAFGVLFPKEKLMLIFLPVPIEARIFIPILLLADMFFGLFSIKGDNIAHFAHIGGAITGFLLIWSLKKHHFKRWF